MQGHRSMLESPGRWKQPRSEWQNYPVKVAIQSYPEILKRALLMTMKMALKMIQMTGREPMMVQQSHWWVLEMSPVRSNDQMILPEKKWQRRKT
jgi:hypothetical protein